MKIFFFTNDEYYQGFLFKLFYGFGYLNFKSGLLTAGVYWYYRII